MNQPTLFDLEAFTKSPVPTPLYDPAWDEITAPQHSDKNLDDRKSPWDEWELRVRAQVSPSTTVESCVGAQVTISTPVKPLVGAHVALDTKKSAPQHDTHWVEKYWVERSSNKYWYYRYCWMTGRKKHRRYLGSVDSPKARLKKEDVEIAIADGQTPAEIEELIRSWGSGDKRQREKGKRGKGKITPNS
ncbi:hypothetical protein A6S26_32010 [Nostoc sp. ATCC 43529]|nr:hypothetical protein A6S26_32010 [Nostoc sp. ATCC 43529]